MRKVIYSAAPVDPRDLPPEKEQDPNRLPADLQELDSLEGWQDPEDR